MLFLAVETSSQRGSLALFDGDACIREECFPEGLLHGREVAARLERLLQLEGLSVGSLKAIAVSLGPGSYTGIRVGVTASKTLGFALRIPVMGESSLRVMAANAAAAGGAGSRLELGGAFRVLTALDGRQRSTFWSLFEIQAGAEGGLDGRVVRSRPDAHGSPEEIIATARAAADGGLTVIGDAAETVVAAGGSATFHRGPPEWDVPRARVLGRLVAAAIESARFDPEAIHRLEPAYLRETEAERKLAARRGP